jgi:stearoyl-CoA desaturase (delta-9 desaturase)
MNVDQGNAAVAAPVEPRVAAASQILAVSGGTAQKVHAALILVLPLLCALYALGQAWSGQVRAWHVALAGSLYVAMHLGITVGFHRLFAHKAFQAHAMVRAVLAVLGSMSAQGPVIYWVANHRRHHTYSDAAGDVHSPHFGEAPLHGWRGFFHAHIGWTFTHRLTNSTAFCKDLLRDVVIRRISQTYYYWVLLGVVIAAAAGWAIDGTPKGVAEGLLWGVGVRLFLSYHLTNSINSVTHLFGYRRFATREQSRNNAWLGLVTLGEAWHNNHHAHPRSAIFGHAWWETDIGGLFIRALARFGLAWDVTRPDPGILNRLRAPMVGAPGAGEEQMANEIATDKGNK